jgi:hypothetical protein
VSEPVPAESVNIGSAAHELHIRVSKDLPAKSARLRRSSPLISEISNNETEFSEQMSYKLHQML